MAPRPAKKPKRSKPQKGAKRAAPPPTPSAIYPPPLEGETRAAYDALCKYLDAGPERSLRAVFNDKGHAKRWSSAFRWVEHAAVYDDARREERLATLAARQRETDLATAEADARLSALATTALFSDKEPTTQGIGLLRDLWSVGRNGADSARVAAVQALVRLAGIDDLRKLRHHRATTPTPPPPPPVLLTPDVVAALEAAATDGQLDALADGPLVDDPPEAGAGDADG